MSQLQQGIEPGSKCGIEYKGWIVETKKHPILSQQEVAQFQNELQVAHLPEMVFGGSSLDLTHAATGVKISFNALDGLRGWVQEQLPPVHIPASALWKQKNDQSVQSVQDYDYTFTTNYSGTVSATERTPPGQVIGDEPSVPDVHVRSSPGTSRQAPAQPAQPAATVVAVAAGAAAAAGSDEARNQARPAGTGAAPPAWRETDDAVDLALLQERAPIYYFSEVVLYEDELADNGISLLSAKIRVMPRCWYVLLRFWLRVDGVLVRVRDTRYFCDFSSEPPSVLRERCYREESFQALAARGIAVEAIYRADASIADKVEVRLTTREKLTLA
eukprot:jgi/Mesen1/10650/ME000009S10439